MWNQRAKHSSIVDRCSNRENSRLLEGVDIGAMAYLAPEYKHDIFFSYPHADADRRGESELKAWSQRFAEDLRSNLISSKRHQNLSFFLDQGQREGERLDEAATPSRALDEAANAVLLVALMSPWYLESRWCRDEREAWAKGIGGDAGRIARGVRPRFRHAGSGHQRGPMAARILRRRETGEPGILAVRPG